MSVYLLGKHKGHNRPRAKITRADVQAMRQLFQQHPDIPHQERYRRIGALFGVCPSSARDVVQNLSFGDPSYDPKAALSPETARGVRPFRWSDLFHLPPACAVMVLYLILIVQEGKGGAG